MKKSPRYYYDKDLARRVQLRDHWFKEDNRNYCKYISNSTMSKIKKANVILKRNKQGIYYIIKSDGSIIKGYKIWNYLNNLECGYKDFNDIEKL
jgi:hypothetical protein